MKKIINGKVYNTETAECIADENRSLYDFHSTSEALYRTARGNWFLHGESSSGGRYSKWVGNSCGGGEDIQALTPAQVVEWAEQARINDDDVAQITELLQLPEA